MRNLPQYLGLWLDDQKLLFGDNVPEILERVIKVDTDYVLMFIDEHAAASKWVAKELEWTVEAEKAGGRIMLLPIVIDEEAYNKLATGGIRNRKHISLKDYSEASIHTLSDTITSELFALVCRDMNNLRNPKPKPTSAVISDLDDLIHSKASLIERIVFPHRKQNPVTVEVLREVINSQDNENLAEGELEPILEAIVSRNLVPGLYFDGFELYLIEEHARWKSQMFHDKKERIGRKVSGLVNNGTKILLDAGSTTSEIAALICKKIETRVLTKILIATTSVRIAEMVSDCCVKMGFDDSFSAVQLFVAGGLIRQGTQAIVPVDGVSSVVSLADHVGGFDIGVIGINGVHAEQGFTTHENSEYTNKMEIMNVSKTRLMVGDSSKVGIILEKKIADFSDEIRFVVDNDPGSEQLRVLIDRIVLA
ncbi:MAG: TIR domain-containing protein [Thaumarchaeota archaeon]|nr:TIR domain-containing protein [Nitrososphaerota archaeon]